MRLADALAFVSGIIWPDADDAARFGQLGSDGGDSSRRVRTALSPSEARWKCVRDDPVWGLLGSGGRSPCELLVALDALCTDERAPVYARGAEDVCLCSAPGYNLYAACMACRRPSQHAHRVQWPSFDEWLSACPHFTSVLSFPTPDDLQIPSWAYAAAPQGGHFNVSQASAIAQERLVHLASRTFDAPENAAVSPTTFPPPNGGGGGGGGGGVDVAAIVGGVVGGAVALVLLLGLVGLVIRSNRRRAALDRIVDRQVIDEPGPGVTAVPPHMVATPPAAWSPYGSQEQYAGPRTSGGPYSHPMSEYVTPGAVGAGAGAGIATWRNDVRHSAHSLSAGRAPSPGPGASTFSGPTASTGYSGPTGSAYSGPRAASGASVPLTTSAFTGDLADIKGSVRDTAAASAAARGGGGLSESDVDRIANRVAALMGQHGMPLGAAMGAAGLGGGAASGPGTPGRVGAAPHDPEAGAPDAPPAYEPSKRP